VVGELYGAGLRLFFGHEVVYVTTNDLSEEGLVRAARQAAQSRAGGAARAALPLKDNTFDSMHKFGQKPWEIGRERKLAWLTSLDRGARSVSSAVTQAQPRLNEKFQRVQIANSLGWHATDERAHARLLIEVFVEDGGQKEGFIENHGFQGTAYQFEGWDAHSFAQDTAKKALQNLRAGYAPAGEFPVVIDNAFGGVIFHEACGHGLETTSVARGASVFCGKLGEKIAHECVTAIDDGTIANGWGSQNVDDEGRPTKRTTLIENGVLKSYIVDELGSRMTGYEPTGSGRRQSYKFAPASRMRNTFIAPGKDSFEEMIRDVDFGIYAKKMGGGSVSPGTGDFNFAVQEAYLIRNGRVEEPVKGATLIGRGIDSLGKITRVSSDMTLAPGMCGSVSGTIPAAVGQPQILVSKMLVGGRS
jgi:TldD protein